MNQNLLESTFAEAQLKADISLFNKAMSKGKRIRIFSKLRKNTRRGTNIQYHPSNCVDHPVKKLGVQSVLIDKIKPNDMKDKNFDQNFFPMNRQSQHRWMSVARARMSNVPIPAVELIKVGENYVVLDGHHRISVARALGEQYIDAKIQ
jgi:hypothetical protein